LEEDKQITLVTGGTGGLGRIIVSTLAANGHFVVFQYHSREKEAERIKDELGDSVMAVQADITDAGDVVRLVHAIDERFQRLDNLICNAGITIDGLVVRYGEHDFENVLDVNLKGCFICVQKAAPFIAGSGGGHIIAMSSYSGLKGKEGQVAYSAAKAGIIGLGKTLAKELSSANIRVNSVLPGYLSTGMGIRTPEAMNRAQQESLLNCLSDPEEVARFLVFLCSTKNITGQVFILDSREVI